MAKEPELKDLEGKDEPLGADDLEGVVGGKPSAPGGDTDPHGSTGSEEEVES